MSHQNKQALSLGWCDMPQPGIGFQCVAPPVGKSSVTVDTGHLMTIAPTGAGKGVSSVIPTLLSYPGTTVVVDPKGENYAVTRAARERMGHKVVVFDPFATLGETGDRINPMSVLAPDSPDLLDDARSLAHNLFGEVGLRNDPFWDMAAVRLLSTLIVMVVSEEHRACRNLTQVLALLALPLGQLQRRISEFLASPLGADYAHCLAHLDVPDRTGVCIVEVARTALGYLQSPRMNRALEVTSFSLEHFDEGAPVTLYLVVPPHKLQSHSGLLRGVLGALCSVMVRRNASPTLETLLMVDEAAQLGYMPQIEQAITLLRGYGVRVWTFWQDLAQLKATYPDTWPTLVNNCRALQLFGFANAASVQQAAEIIGGGADLYELTPEQQIVHIAGERPLLSRRLNYLTDGRFQGEYSPNPYHAKARFRSIGPSLQAAEASL